MTLPDTLPEWFDLSSAILIFLLIGFTYTVWTISKGKRINFADMFKGEAGQASAGRFIALGAWVFASWFLMVVAKKYVTAPGEAPGAIEYALGYLGICIAGYAINKGTEAWKDRPPPEKSK